MEDRGSARRRALGIGAKSTRVEASANTTMGDVQYGPGSLRAARDVSEPYYTHLEHSHNAGRADTSQRRRQTFSIHPLPP